MSIFDFSDDKPEMKKNTKKPKTFEAFNDETEDEDDVLFLESTFSIDEGWDSMEGIDVKDFFR